jgi:hypothetical protein
VDQLQRDRDFDGLVRVLEDVSADGATKANVAGALGNLSNLAAANAANKAAVVAAGALPQLVELLRDGSDEGKKNAALALSQLAHMNNDAAGALRNLAVQQ